MSNYIKFFDTHQEYEDYIYSQSAFFPNVSYCEDTGHVHYNPTMPPPPPETRVVAYFNVTSQNSEGTHILYNTTNVSEIEIDGVVQPSVVSYYKFSTLGEHIVKYTLTDPTQISNTMMSYIDRHLYKVTIPDGVTTIGDQAFNGCYALKQVIIPNTVTSIGYMAFQSTDLRDGVQWSDHLTTIGRQAFAGTSLGKNQNGVVELPNSVTTIGERAFQRLDYMTEMYVGENVTSIGDNAFGTNSGMINFYISATTPPTIGDTIFYNHGNDFHIVVYSWSKVPTYKAAWPEYAQYIRGRGENPL